MAFRVPTEARPQRPNTHAIAEAVAASVVAHLDSSRGPRQFIDLSEKQQAWLIISVRRFCRRFHVKSEKRKIKQYLIDCFQEQYDDDSNALFNPIVPRMRDGWAKYVSLCMKQHEPVVMTDRPPLHSNKRKSRAPSEGIKSERMGDAYVDDRMQDERTGDEDIEESEATDAAGRKRLKKEAKLAKKARGKKRASPAPISGQLKCVSRPPPPPTSVQHHRNNTIRTDKPVNPFFAPRSTGKKSDGRPGEVSQTNAGRSNDEQYDFTSSDDDDENDSSHHHKNNQHDYKKQNERKHESSDDGDSESSKEHDNAQSIDPWSGLEISESQAANNESETEKIILCPLPSTNESPCSIFCRSYLREHQVVLKDAQKEWKMYAEEIHKSSKEPGSPQVFSVPSTSDGLWEILRCWKPPVPRRRHPTKTNFYARDVSQALASCEFPARQTKYMHRLPLKTYVLYRLVLSGFENEDDLTSRHDQLSGEQFSSLSLFVEHIRLELLALGIHCFTNRQGKKIPRHFSNTQVARAIKELEKERIDEINAGADETSGFRVALVKELPRNELKLAKRSMTLLTKFYTEKKKKSPGSAASKKQKSKSPVVKNGVDEEGDLSSGGVEDKVSDVSVNDEDASMKDEQEGVMPSSKAFVEVSVSADSKGMEGVEKTDTQDISDAVQEGASEKDEQDMSDVVQDGASEKDNTSVDAGKSASASSSPVEEDPSDFFGGIKKKSVATTNRKEVSKEVEVEEEQQEQEQQEQGASSSTPKSVEEKKKKQSSSASVPKPKPFVSTKLSEESDEDDSDFNSKTGYASDQSSSGTDDSSDNNMSVVGADADDNDDDNDDNDDVARSKKTGVVMNEGADDDNTASGTATGSKSKGGDNVVVHEVAQPEVRDERPEKSADATLQKAQQLRNTIREINQNAGGSGAKVADNSNAEADDVSVCSLVQAMNDEDDASMDTAAPTAAVSVDGKDENTSILNGTPPRTTDDDTLEAMQKSASSDDVAETLVCMADESDEVDDNEEVEQQQQQQQQKEQEKEKGGEQEQDREQGGGGEQEETSVPKGNTTREQVAAVVDENKAGEISTDNAEQAVQSNGSESLSDAVPISGSEGSR